MPAAAPAPPDLPIRRNTALLSASLAANSGMMQLSAAVASLTFVLVIGVKGLLGLGPAIVLASGAFAAFPAGRAMDRFGRVPVIATGFVIGTLGGGLAALGSAARARPPPVFIGLVCVGTAGRDGAARAHGRRRHVPAGRRARGIALVLVGAVFGAILGPAVFSPLLSGRELDGDSLALLWLAGSCFTLLGPCAGAVRTARPEAHRRGAGRGDARCRGAPGGAPEGDPAAGPASFRRSSPRRRASG